MFPFTLRFLQFWHWSLLCNKTQNSKNLGPWHIHFSTKSLIMLWMKCSICLFGRPSVCLSEILDELKIKLLYCKNLPLREGALLSIVTRFPTSCVNFLPLILWCVTQHHLINQILVFLKIYPPELPNCTHIDYLHVLRVRT